MQPCPTDNRSFFVQLQKAEGLDLRDQRGKRHDLAVVLTGVVLALLSHRDGCLSSLHRHLKNHAGRLLTALGLAPKAAISRAQLPRVLATVSVAVFDQLLFANYGVQLTPQERQWFAVDGKELKGSIEKGAKRGEAVVTAIAHATGQTQSQTYYAGDKESEVPAVRQLLHEQGLEREKVSLDALHCKPKTLEPIAQAGGTYLVGLKENQPTLLAAVQAATATRDCLYQTAGVEKGHGRSEERAYQVYDLAGMDQDERWAQCQISTAVQVTRTRRELKSGKASEETSYYLSNQTTNYAELCVAVRRHWSVETNNHLRDVTLREDQMRSKKRRPTASWQASGRWSRRSYRPPGVSIKKPNSKILPIILIVC